MNLIDQIDAVIFDLDGTLLDTETLSSSCLLLALREFGVHLSEVRWDLKKRIIGLPGREWTTIVIDSITTSAIQDSNAFQSISWQRLLERWEYYMSEYAEDVTMLPGVEALLSHCHKLKQANNLKPLRFAIATSSRKSAAEKKLSRFGLMKDLMDVMVFGDDDEIVEGKPKPDIFLLTERCLVFEDSLNGIKAGKAASMIAIAVPDPRIFVDDIDCEEYRRRADFCYSSITDVIPSLPLLL